MTLSGVGIIPGDKPKLPSAKWIWNHLLRTKAWVSYVLSMQNNFVRAAAPFAATLGLKEAGAQNGNIRAWTQPIMTDFNFGECRSCLLDYLLHFHSLGMCVQTGDRWRTPPLRRSLCPSAVSAAAPFASSLPQRSCCTVASSMFVARGKPHDTAGI